MKQYKFHALFLLLCLIFTARTSSRSLTTEQGPKEIELNEITSGNSLEGAEDTDMSKFQRLMGQEDCENRDEECLRRRIVLEAHLDYIYTQGHNKSSQTRP
ncbi:putative phytosulfokines 6 [Malania oleifera]|uniref:putative phytosulfokines 6 n=1 Tax=Malania oleifera TaxID=397392 RepID=UPI0025AE3A77|nr:putative phytosulfokines 6 [Malania oleifera]